MNHNFNLEKKNHFYTSITFDFKCYKYSRSNIYIFRYYTEAIKIRLINRKKKEDLTHARYFYFFCSFANVSSVNNSQRKYIVINKEVQSRTISPTQKPKCHYLALLDLLYFRVDSCNISPLYLKGLRK